MRSAFRSGRLRKREIAARELELRARRSAPARGLVRDDARSDERFVRQLEDDNAAVDLVAAHRRGFQERATALARQRGDLGLNHDAILLEGYIARSDQQLVVLRKDVHEDAYPHGSVFG